MVRTKSKVVVATTASIRYGFYPVAKIEENPWNPNRMPADKYEAIREDMKLGGPAAIDPILTASKRVIFKDPSIPADIRITIGGNHRLKLARELGWREIREEFDPAIDSEEKARAIFQVLCDIPSVNNDLLRAFTLINQIRLVEKRGAVGSKFTGRLGFKASDVSKAERLLEMMAISPNTATAYLRLLDLPGSIQRKVICATTDTNSDEWLRKGFITVKMAYELSRIADNELRLQLYRRIIQERIRYIHLKFIVDEILEKGAEQFRNMGSGSARKRGGNSMVHLSMRCFRLGSSLWNYRAKLPLDKMRMEKTIFRASLKQLRRGCLELVSKINVLLKETIEGNLERVNQDFSLVMRAGSHGQVLLRYSFPKDKTNLLRLKPSDKLLIKIINIERKKPAGAGEGAR